jgi:hypothetical protein
MTKVFFTCCYLIIALNSMAQSPTGSSFDFNKKVTVAQLREDLKTLKDSLEIIIQLLTTMKRYFSDEGTNEILQLKRIEQRFAFQYYLTYGYARNFALQYSIGNKPPVTRQVNAQPFSVIRQNRTKNQAKYPNLQSLFPQPPYLSLTINEQQRSSQHW